MPRVEEKERPTWHDLQNMIFENLFFPNLEEVEKLRVEVNKFVEERRNVCKADKRDND